MKNIKVDIISILRETLKDGYDYIITIDGDHHICKYQHSEDDVKKLYFKPIGSDTVFTVDESEITNNIVKIDDPEFGFELSEPDCFDAITDLEDGDDDECKTCAGYEECHCFITHPEDPDYSDLEYANDADSNIYSGDSITITFNTNDSEKGNDAALANHITLIGCPDYMDNNVILTRKEDGSGSMLTICIDDLDDKQDVIKRANAIINYLIEMSLVRGKSSDDENEDNEDCRKNCNCVRGCKHCYCKE